MTGKKTSDLLTANFLFRSLPLFYTISSLPFRHSAGRVLPKKGAYLPKMMTVQHENIVNWLHRLLPDVNVPSLNMNEWTLTPTSDMFLYCKCWISSTNQTKIRATRCNLGEFSILCISAQFGFFPSDATCSLWQQTNTHNAMWQSTLFHFQHASCGFVQFARKCTLCSALRVCPIQTNWNNKMKLPDFYCIHRRKMWKSKCKSVP